MDLLIGSLWDASFSAKDDQGKPVKAKKSTIL